MTVERRRATDLDLSQMRLEITALREDVKPLEKAMLELKGAFDGNRDVTQTLLDAMVANHADFKTDQKEFNKDIRTDVDSLKSSRDRLWGWFIGASGTGATLGAAIARMLGHG